MVRAGAPWRLIPNDLPPWRVVYEQTQLWIKGWIKAGCFEAIVDDLRALLRLDCGRKAQPTAAIVDARTLQSTPESGERADYDGYKRKRGSKVHGAVDTLGNPLAVHVTPASEQERAQVAVLAKKVQAATQQSVTLVYADQGCTGGTCPGRRGRGNGSGGGEACGGEAGVRAAASAMSGGAQLRVGGALSSAGEGLRAAS